MAVSFDAIIVGAGFGGIYMCKKLVDQGLSVKLIEAAPDVGGTWYWNRYPGAMSDTPSFLFRYSWDLDDLRQYPWAREYLRQPEVLAYLQHVVKRHDLRRHMQFNNEMTGASWDASLSRWTVSLSPVAERPLTCRFLISALGLLSKQNYPDIPGLDSFRGEMYHSGSWPASYNFANKKVGIVGSGSTGVQIITALADEVEQLVSFQRHPQYVVPAADRETSADSWCSIAWEQTWQQVKGSILGFGFEESAIPTFSVSPEERHRIFEEAWAKGNGFYFMFGTFCDITYNEQANKEAQDFMRSKIREKVKDPAKAEKLLPKDWFARRPLCDTGYYEKFNKSNVDVVDINANPISEITPKGIRTQDGAEWEFDVIILATGFDAVDGNYKHLSITGSQRTLEDTWREGPESYLGISVSGFPNLFMITGPNSPFTNLPPTIETQVEFISQLILEANQSASSSSRQPLVEAEPTAVLEWTRICDELSINSLFRKTDSWIFGANVIGKKPSVLFYFGGLANYRRTLQNVMENNNRGFKPFGI
ncbi:hypothetical protein N7457_006962 [Penicillium paradoxum]|uniref:uncharacterized protein n=1 Tax=Penicillium paradoxum TaxID=176176 RepID=UPI0025491062|nr:uncharacterized protein N7457_006962 [Penicillium paradoxum]KAJ5779242.1 hypothetical protein N7457_006962 [Penicillium paradoxum]